MKYLTVIFLGVVFFSGCSSFFSGEQMNDVPEKGSKFRSAVLDYLEDQSRRDPGNVNLYLEKAKYYKEEGWPTEALIALNEVIRRDSVNLDAYRYRQSYYLRHSRYRDALTDINRLESLGAFSPDLVNAKMSAYFGLQRFDEFLELTKQYDIDFLNALNRKLLGQYHLSKGDTLSGIRHFYFNYLSGEIDGPTLLVLVDLLSRASYESRALEILSESEASDPYFDLIRSEILIKKGEIGMGVFILKSLVKRGNLESLWRLNDYYLKLGQLDSAILINDNYLQLQDSSAQVLNKQGRLFQNKFYWTKALVYYEAALKISPHDEEALREAQIVEGKIAYLRKLRSNADTTSN